MAPVRARQVLAKSVLARVRVLRALVHVSALVGTDVGVSLRADARERTDQVLARELAIVRRRNALVHVCR